MAATTFPPPTFLQPAVSPRVTRALATAAAGFLDGLSERQRAHAQMPFDAPERHDWHYVPRQRPGMPLREMDDAQRAAALALLRAGLSDAGGRTALAIMKRENVLRRADPGEGYDPLTMPSPYMAIPGTLAQTPAPGHGRLRGIISPCTSP